MRSPTQTFKVNFSLIIWKKKGGMPTNWENQTKRWDKLKEQKKKVTSWIKTDEIVKAPEIAGKDLKQVFNRH